MPQKDRSNDDEFRDRCAQRNNCSYCQEHARHQRTLIQMTKSKFQQLFSLTTWRRWLEKLCQFEEAMDMTELDFLERRVRSLEAQVAELRAQARTR